MNQEQKALEILQVMAETAAAGGGLLIADDWGFGTATITNHDGEHTHIGSDNYETEQQNFEAFVDGMHELLVKRRGLSWEA